MTSLPRGRLTVNAKLLRDLIRARVSLVRLEARVMRRDFLPVLRQIQRDILAAIGKAEAGVPLDSVTMAQLDRILRDADEILKNAATSLPAAAEASATSVASQQARMVHAIAKRAAPEGISSIFSGLNVGQLAQVVQTETAELAGPWFTNWAGRSSGKIRMALAASVGQGEDIAKATKRVAAALQTSRSEVATIVRTAMQSAANRAQQAYQDENRSVFKGVQWTATLDTRTCPKCGPLDGTVWTYEADPSGESAGLVDEMPPIPRHPNCRCVTVPITRSWRELGLDIDDVPDASSRASMDGDVPGSLTWEDWFASQPENIQRSILGPKKWAAWQAGGLLESAPMSLRRVARSWVHGKNPRPIFP